MIEIWEFQNELAAGWPFDPFVHMSGLHAADMHKIDPPQEIWPRKVRRRFCMNPDRSCLTRLCTDMGRQVWATAFEKRMILVLHGHTPTTPT